MKSEREVISEPHYYGNPTAACQRLRFRRVGPMSDGHYHVGGLGDVTPESLRMWARYVGGHRGVVRGLSEAIYSPPGRPRREGADGVPVGSVDQGSGEGSQG